jgi:hypothetical protein
MFNHHQSVMNSKPLRLVLTPEQTATIRESGIHFMAGSPVSINVISGRATLLLFECSRETADAACGVASGTHTAKRKPTTTSKP